MTTARGRDARGFLKVSEQPLGLGESKNAAKHGKEVPRLHSARVLPTCPKLFIELDDGEVDHHSAPT